MVQMMRGNTLQHQQPHPHPPAHPHQQITFNQDLSILTDLSHVRNTNSSENQVLHRHHHHNHHNNNSVGSTTGTGVALDGTVTMGRVTGGPMSNAAQMNQCYDYHQQDAQKGEGQRPPLPTQQFQQQQFQQEQQQQQQQCSFTPSAPRAVRLQRKREREKLRRDHLKDSFSHLTPILLKVDETFRKKLQDRLNRQHFLKTGEDKNPHTLSMTTLDMDSNKDWGSLFSRNELLSEAGSSLERLFAKTKKLEETLATMEGCSDGGMGTDGQSDSNSDVTTSHGRCSPSQKVWTNQLLKTSICLLVMVFPSSDCLVSHKATFHWRFTASSRLYPLSAVL